MLIKRAGFTIVEMLVVGGLLLIVMGLVASAMIPSFTLFQNELAGTELFQSALMLTQRFKGEVANSMATTMTVDPDNTRLAFLTKDEMLPMEPGAAKARWGRSFVLFYYEPDKKRIVRKLWPAPGQSPPVGLFDGPLPPRLNVTQMRAATSQRNGTERTMVWNCEECRFYDSDTTDNLNLPVRLEFVVTQEARKGGSEDLLKRTLAVEAYPRSMEW